VQTLYNPFFSRSDNLVSCWLARHLMTEDFILLNGDTLFEGAILDRLLGTLSRPITLVTDSKLTYDADDMKVMLDEHRVLRVGKTLQPDQSHGESIGMMLFRENGPDLFVSAVEGALRKPQALKRWYLSVIDEMAQSGLVWNCPIQGLRWTEVDYPVDLEDAQKLVTSWGAPSSFKTPSARQFSEPIPSHSLYPRPMPLQETEASPPRSRGLTGAKDEREPHEG
jgi:choline kinase